MILNVVRGSTTERRLAFGGFAIELRYLPRPTGGRYEESRVGEEAQEKRRRDIREHKGDGVTENDVCDGFVDLKEKVDDTNEKKEHGGVEQDPDCFHRTLHVMAANTREIVGAYSCVAVWFTTLT